MASVEIRVEIVFAAPGEQLLCALSVPLGATIAEVIESSPLAERFPDFELGAMQVGVWGHPAASSQVVRDGDRVEIYRPLQMDPREARRRLAAAGQTMGSHADS